jgi:hypothetical protein
LEKRYLCSHSLYISSINFDAYSLSYFPFVAYSVSLNLGREDDDHITALSLLD